METRGTRIGTEVAGFRILSVLGRGGMSVVYLAEQVRLGRKVALKLLASELVYRDETFRDRFLRESHLAARLDHPNIIPIYDAGEAEGSLYIAMRYIDGPDLGQIIEQGPLSLGRTIYILEQVASALDAAHEDGLVHRDVKPANILVVGASDRVYLTDFGVAKPTTSAGLTRTGFFIGTPDYSAPEQIEGREVDPRTDVYALGGVLYACLTGSAPFARDTEVAVLQAHLLQPPPRLTDKRPDLPRAFNAVIASAMAKSRDERYPSCGDFVAAARAASFEQPISLPAVESVERTVITPRAQETATPEPVAPHTTATPTDSSPPMAGPGPAPAAAAEIVGEGSSLQPQADSVGDGSRAKLSRLLRGSPWTLGVLALVAIAAIAAAVYYATRSNTTSATRSGGGTAQKTQRQPSPSKGIAALIPGTLYENSCVMQSAPILAGAVQSVVCTPPTSPAERKLAYYPDRWDASIFPDSTTLYSAYDSLRRQHDIGQNRGRCNGTDWGGEGPWEHGPGKPGGRRFCYFEGNDAVMVWTHEKLGQASHVDMLGVAHAGGSDHASLFNWWRFWHHRTGKCAEEGCTAQLPTVTVTRPATTEAGTTKKGDHQMGQPKQGDLLALLPSDVPTKSCKQAAGNQPGGLKTLSCDFTDKQGRRILLDVDTFRNRNFLYSTYRDRGASAVKAAGGMPDPQLKTETGECSGTAWLGEGSWSHEPGGPPAGRRSCFIASGNSKVCKPTGLPACSVMVWTSDISNLFMQAVLPSTRHRDLFTWWQFHAHLFG